MITWTHSLVSYSGSLWLVAHICGYHHPSRLCLRWHSAARSRPRPSLCFHHRCFPLSLQWAVLGLPAHHTVSSALRNKYGFVKNPNPRVSPEASPADPMLWPLSWASVGGLALAPAPRPSSLWKENSPWSEPWALPSEQEAHVGMGRTSGGGTVKLRALGSLEMWVPNVGTLGEGNPAVCPGWRDCTALWVGACWLV